MLKTFSTQKSSFRLHDRQLQGRPDRSVCYFDIFGVPDFYFKYFCHHRTSTRLVLSQFVWIIQIQERGQKKYCFTILLLYSNIYKSFESLALADLMVGLIVIPSLVAIKVNVIFRYIMPFRPGFSAYTIKI